MVFPPIQTRPSLCGAWRYWRPSYGGIVELGTVHGQDVALPAHFHDEDQITFVLRGQRHFVIGGQPISVPAGEGIHISAGTPHCSLSGPSDVSGINIYTEPGAYAAPKIITVLSEYCPTRESVDWAEIATLIEGCRHMVKTVSNHTPGGSVRDTDWNTVRQAAQMAGMSREGFSRRFARLYGMPPHGFHLTGKLNEARRLLRAGEPIAAVAVEAGFADQSHLGRCFRRAFGVTPGRYNSPGPVTSVL